MTTEIKVFENTIMQAKVTTRAHSITDQLNQVCAALKHMLLVAGHHKRLSGFNYNRH